MHARLKPSLYEQLSTLPEGLIGEILDGQLYTQPRPAGPHAIAAADSLACLRITCSVGRMPDRAIRHFTTETLCRILPGNFRTTGWFRGSWLVAEPLSLSALPPGSVPKTWAELSAGTPLSPGPTCTIP